jgi:hypothetical protein
LNAPLDYHKHFEKHTDDDAKPSDEEEQEHGHAEPTEPGAETAGRLSAGLMTYFERGKRRGVRGGELYLGAGSRDERLFHPADH